MSAKKSNPPSRRKILAAKVVASMAGTHALADDPASGPTPQVAIKRAFGRTVGCVPTPGGIMLTPDDIKMLTGTEFRMLLPTISRWNIIDMRRKQSVAEHSFGVLIYSMSLYKFMQQETPHNTFDWFSLVEWAIDHDMDEIMSGDMPAPMKAAIEAVSPGAVEAASANMMATKLPSYTIRKNASAGSYPYDIVKIADKLEEVLYNKAHGHDWRAADALTDGLRLLRERLLKAEKAHPRYDWERARTWLAFFLRPITKDDDTIEDRVLNPA